jgi:hypothetical protein
VNRCRFGAKLIFSTKPTSTHTYWKKAIRVSRCRFGGINISPANFTSTRFDSDFHAKQVDAHLAGKVILRNPLSMHQTTVKPTIVMVVDFVAVSFIVVAAAFTNHQCKHHHR